jgi:hypothetical protein
MLKSRILQLAIGLSLSMPAVANDEAVASLKIIAGPSITADWYGDGALTLRKQLCISSTTGRYTLDVSVPAGLFSKADAPKIEIRFKDETGVMQNKVLAAGSEMSFAGAAFTRAGECSTGNTAAIEIYVPENILMAQQSGNYFDQISLTVRPL